MKRLIVAIAVAFALLLALMILYAEYGDLPAVPW